MIETNNRHHPTLVFICMLSFFFLAWFTGCANSGMQAEVDIDVVLYEDLEIENRQFEYLGEVRAKCTKWRCDEITNEACQSKLKKKTRRMEGNAVAPFAMMKHGRGHGGGKLVAITCKGKALRLLEADP